MNKYNKYMYIYIVIHLATSNYNSNRCTAVGTYDVPTASAMVSAEKYAEGIGTNHAVLHGVINNPSDVLVFS